VARQQPCGHEGACQNQQQGNSEEGFKQEIFVFEKKKQKTFDCFGCGVPG
jgi:hypothetical protein